MKTFLFASLLFSFGLVSIAVAQDTVATEPVAARSSENAGEKYTLRYQFNAGEVVRWQVVHLGSTETRIQGNTQTSRARSSSVKVWKVTDVADNGQISLTHTVYSVDMWQQLTDRPEVRYNSQTDDVVPQEYEQVATTVGIPLTRVTISTEGEIIDRDNSSPIDLGLGDIVMLLPPKPVKVGGNWYEPSELRIAEKDGRKKKIKIRKLYTLEKVETGVATIRVKTEVLTPVDDARIKAQLVQQLTNGVIKFDVDAGRVLSKKMDWDETIVGFNGADSMMKYLARFTEKLL